MRHRDKMNTISNHDDEKTIFITIAACGEFFLEQTIRSAISLASNPNRISFGVFNNILDKNLVSYWDVSRDKSFKSKEEFSMLSNPFFTNNEQIVYAELTTSVPMGVGHGRFNAALLSSEESYDYFFQIDSHTIFSNDWDKIIIENYNKVKQEEEVDSIILSCIPGISWTYDPKNRNDVYSYQELLNENGIKFLNPYENNYNNLNFDFFNGVPRISLNGWAPSHSGSTFSSENVGVPIVIGGEGFAYKDYEETNCVHASFMFGKYSMLRDVMHDPQDSFSGDQTNYSLRLLSRGYRIFSVKKPILGSLNKSDEYGLKDVVGGSDRVKSLDTDGSWRDFESKSKSGQKLYESLLINSKKRCEDIFSGKYLGYWGAPDMDSLKIAKGKMGLD
jgi:hypothetical protein